MGSSVTRNLAPPSGATIADLDLLFPALEAVLSPVVPIVAATYHVGDVVRGRL